MSHFFIGRPVFAAVIAILICLAGAISLATMPVSQFPKLTPPTVSLTCSYDGASAKTMQDSIAQVIEQRMTGLDKLLYINTGSSSEGRMSMRLTFDPSVDGDIAQMQVQNRLQLAMPRLPESVKNEGVRVRKVSDTFLEFYSFYEENGRIPTSEIGDFLSSTLVDPLTRLDGVGDATLFGAPYAMRIWLNPNRLRSFSLTPMDVVDAVKAQNDQISVGQIGALPSTPDQEINVTLLSRAKLETIEQFRNIVIRVNPDGSAVFVRDVARVEMGQESYIVSSRLDRRPSVSIGIQLTEGANAVETHERVAAFMKRMEKFFPEGLTYTIPYSTVPFVQASIHSVFRTLMEAIMLVAVIMFLFLQSLRATVIPIVAVPIVLLGAMAVMKATGTSINTLSMFGMVLAIGLLVDDAIVVVENTERIMHEEHLSPLEATHKSMSQITYALIGVAAVLSAVFLPMAFFGGMPGAIYREFSLTIVSAMVLSVFVALVVTPPMCARLLREHGTGGGTGPFRWFNRFVDASTHRYSRAVRTWTHHGGLVMSVYVLIIAACVWALRAMPTSFLPVEDQGSLLMNVFLPPGSTREDTSRVCAEIEDYIMNREGDCVDHLAIMLGLGPNGARGQNIASGYMRLKPWNERTDPEKSAGAIVRRARARFADNHEARIVFLQPPQVSGLGQSSGISMELEDQGSLGYDALIKARAELLAMARNSPKLFNPHTTSLDDIPQVRLDIDDLKAGAYSLSAAAINSNLNAAWGGTYVNDFVDRGRIKRVYVQGDAPYRMNPDNMHLWYFRNTKGEMVPLDAVATAKWTQGPAMLERYNGVQATAITASAAPGVSSGDAMEEMTRFVEKLPQGIGLEWTGLSYQEQQSGHQAPFLYALSILVVFLCLAALYESWTIPIAVILVVPIGVLGALGFSTMRGLYNDIYFQVGLLAVIGLSAKNAILIVEFARALAGQGKSIREAAVEAARLRIRPIIMTSLAFLLGVLPLSVSHGAGAASQHAIGTGIIGGTFLATALGIFFIPVFFVVVNRVFLSRRRKKDLAARAEKPETSAKDAS